MIYRKSMFVLLAVLCLVYGSMSTAVAQDGWYQPAPQFGAELQVTSGSQTGDTIYIRAGSSVDFQVVKPGTTDAPVDFDTKYVYIWSCQMEPVVITSLVEDSLTYTVTFGDGSSSSTNTSGSHAYAEPGIYAVSCTVDDLAPFPVQNDAPVTVTVTVIVDDATAGLTEPPIHASAMQSPSAPGSWQADPLDITTGQTVYFRGDAPESPSHDEDLDGTGFADDQITAYSWDFGDSCTATGPAVSHVFSSRGCYIVSLRANDEGTPVDDPLSTPDQLLVRVFDTAPAAPIVTEPALGDLYCSLTPLIRWTGQIHDQYQIRITIVDDLDSTPVWDSGELDADTGLGSCANNIQLGSAFCTTDLQEGITYYAYARLRNALGWGQWSQSGHSFAVLTSSNPPENTSVSPITGTFSTGLPGASFTVTYDDYCRYVNIDTAEFLIDDSSLDKVEACYLRYDQNTNLCSLADDQDGVWIGDDTCTPGSTNTLENSYVRVYLQDTSITSNNSTLSVTWKVEFKPAFAGAKTLALAVTNDKDLHDPDNFEAFGTISVVAASGPISTITSPANGSYITSFPTTIEGTASHPSGISLVEVGMDMGGTWVSATGSTTWSYTWDEASDGWYNLKSRATDGNAPPNVEIPGAGVNVIVDTVPPSTTIIEPSNGATIVGDEVVIRGSAFDYTSRVSKVEVSVDGGATWSEAIGTSFFYYAHPVSSSGPLTVSVRSTDHAGHVESPAPSVSITVDYQQQMYLMSGGMPADYPADIKANLFETQKMIPVGPYSVLNTATGNVLTTIPIAGWDSMGDLGIEFTVYHQAMRPGRPEDGTTRRWMHSYQSVLQKDDDGKIRIYHPWGSEQWWDSNLGGIWGNVETLTDLGSGAGYVLTRKDQIKVYFTHASVPNTWLPKYIEQPTGQRIVLHYNAAHLLERVEDPDGNRWLNIFWQTVSDDTKWIYHVYSCERSGWNPKRYEFRTDDHAVFEEILYPTAQTGDIPYTNYAPKRIRIDFNNKHCEIDAIQDPNGSIWRYKYRGYGRPERLYEVIGPSGTTTSFSYTTYTDKTRPPWIGPYGFVTRAVDPLGRVTKYWYFDWYRTSFPVTIASKWKDDARGEVARDDWYGLCILGIDQHATVDGRLERRHEDFNWHSKQWGDLKWHMDPMGNVSKFAWDTRHNLLSTENMLGEMATMSYNAYDQLETVTTPAHPGQPAKVKRYTYDPNYHYLIASRVDPDGINIKSNIGYDQYGNKQSECGPYQNGEAIPPSVTYVYDEYSPQWQYHTYPERIIDQTGRFVQAWTDALGEKHWETQPRMAIGQALAGYQWKYDKLGRPFHFWQSGGSVHGDIVATKTYYPGGQVESERDENGYLSEYQYDFRGNVTWERHEEDATHAVFRVNTYDTVGRLIEIRIGREGPQGTEGPWTVVNYEYDGFDRLAKAMSPATTDFPNGTETKFFYDGNDNLIRKIDAKGHLTAFEYDKAGRLMRRSHCSGGCSILKRPYERVAEYKYYPDGLLWKVCDWTHDWNPDTKAWMHDPALPAREFLYDTAGRMTDEICHDLGRRIQYEYTGAGQTKTLEIRDLSNTLLATYSYTYYPDNRLKTIHDPDGGITHFYYDFRGRLNRKELPSGSYTVYEYDDSRGGQIACASAKNPLARMAHFTTVGNPIRDFRYTYDKAGNVLTHSAGSDLVTYGYDRLYRLTSETREGDFDYGYSYTYDERGNRLTKHDALAGTINYVCDRNNKLRSATLPDQTVVGYEYDANGNLIRKTQGGAVTEYEYDLDNNLTVVIPPTGPISYFGYNSSGERIWKDDSTGTTRFLYSGGSLLQELDSATLLKTWYNPGISETNVSTGRKLYYHHDRLGSTTTLSTDTGPSDTGFAYDAWGNLIYNGGTFDTRHRYVGKAGYYSDPDTGLLKLGARYYDPHIGRFITQDPARDGLNWYAYAGGNPVNFADPSGLVPCLVDALAGRIPGGDSESASVLLDFIFGTGSDKIRYESGDQYTRELAASKYFGTIRKEIHAAIRKGICQDEIDRGFLQGTMRAALYTFALGDFRYEAALQAGDYNVQWWYNKQKGLIGYKVANQIDWNSLAYPHSPELSNWALTELHIPSEFRYQERWDRSQFRPCGTVMQYFTWHEAYRP